MSAAAAVSDRGLARRVAGVALIVAGSVLCLAIYAPLLLLSITLYRDPPLVHRQPSTLSAYLQNLSILFAIIVPSSFVVGILMVIPINLSSYGRRLLAGGPDPSDDRPPVLLLRSFDDDGLKVMSQWQFSLGDILWLWHPFKVLNWFFAGHPLTLEERMARKLSRLGPVIAVGRPGERLPPIGFARRYYHNDSWKDAVERHIRDCQLVVMVLGKIDKSEDPEKEVGLAWEIRTLIEMGVDGRLGAEQLVLAIPPLGREEIQRRWDAFCRLSDGRFVGIIEGDERFIRFDPTWKPMAVCASSGVFSGRNQGLARAYAKALSSLLARHGLADDFGEKSRRWGRRTVEGALLGAISLSVPSLFVDIFVPFGERQPWYVILAHLITPPQGYLLLAGSVLLAIVWPLWERPPGV